MTMIDETRAALRVRRRMHRLNQDDVGKQLGWTGSKFSILESEPGITLSPWLVERWEQAIEAAAAAKG